VKEAIDIYKSILYIDDSMAIPYMKLARLYAADDNAVSAALALKCYQKYLTLKPSDTNSSAIQKEMDALQVKITENQQNGIWQAVDVNLKKTIQGSQEKTKDIILSVVHPALKAESKEEIKKEVDSTYSLWDNAQATNNSQDGINYLEKMLKQIDPTNPLYPQATTQLAEFYGKQGKVQKMQEILTSLEESTEIAENLTQSPNIEIKDALPFKDDICGVWVSDLTYGEDAVPYLAMNIYKKSNDEYVAEFMPQCIFQNQNWDKYSSSDNTEKAINTNTKLTESNKSVIKNNTDGITFTFGDAELVEKLSKTVADAGIHITGKLGSQVSREIIEKAGGFFGGQIGALGAGLATGLLQDLLARATTPVKYSKYTEVKINRIAAGYAELNLLQIGMKDRGGNQYRTDKNTKMRIAKLYPNYNIQFAYNIVYNKKNNRVDATGFNYCKDAAEREKINREAYGNLANKISDYFWTKSVEDPNMKIQAQISIEFFKNATNGLSYTSFSNESGYYEGWTNHSGQLNSTGKCKLQSGHEYIGTWKNNAYSGNGTLTYKNKFDEIIFRYTGIFDKNELHGEGLYQDTLFSYEGNFKKGKFDGEGKLKWKNGDMLSGIWKNNNFMHGSGNYEDGVFTGKWKYIEKENSKTSNLLDNTAAQKPMITSIISSLLIKKESNVENLKQVRQTFPVPHGEGSFVNAGGETITGKWKNGELITKK
jgi:hypothetical protein